MSIKDKRWFSKWMTFRYRNFKQYYYFKSALKLIIPNFFFQIKRQLILSSYNNKSNSEKAYIDKRVNYYIKLNTSFSYSNIPKRLGDLKPGKKQRTYFFDTREITRYFPNNNLIDYEFGDITEVPPHPAIVKSRPINDSNQNSILLKLNKIRHFTFPKDITPYDKKKDLLVWRGAFKTVHIQRIKFVEKWFDHPQCNVAHVSNLEPFLHWRKPKLNMYEMLQYKFVMVIEGYDVATSLKWVMASNSVAVMPKPKYETWFMEGTLIPDYHYIQVKDDYSDVVDKMNYYIANPDKAEAIIKNAHDYIDQFRNKKRERLISLMVLNKYFQLQNQ
ncbi:lipopolysaccharide biosynthesis protein [Carboxylicivirga sp. A043]|uniref:glycosyl transferase family 90 n=1 Tax=Carboxylicivirga litoralis TaxID=2816963 RepID=UPI0021CAE6C7|nr:glycosyl transferase family 90 [Carboxylicivirga sp. A043]MCU4156463.1 lipopolysaccharide biosynthesis protein [Carboxylicivirga sp. A043]